MNDKALEEPVALVVLLGKQEHLTSVRLEEIASVVKPRGIPIMVDAASEHIERPSPWLARGAGSFQFARVFAVILCVGLATAPARAGPPANRRG